ncbi:M15 family metallopeptidase [Cryomorpha ignava]|uniref:D-alanyl-D-alanine dipeptidase n=1 Tax=Cryomorpha ignava TaxID=101383 RepID=A0A7K3WPX3_9FLAO|nr:M15 family metallopeptidase [Cryomorpha ignava]NEN23713.1 M15 family metallopeptidase [Cryomorpha ignava]
MGTYLVNLLIYALITISLNPVKEKIERSQFDSNIPSDFIEIQSRPPNVYIDVRYATSNNFVGKRINGYNAEKILLTRAAADSLEKAIELLNRLGYGIIIYDGYRPQKAVNMFVSWSRLLNDTINKQAFYPDVSKKNLFKQGYIASKSGHSRGSTIDLGLVYISNGEIVLMGTSFDFFGPESASKYQALPKDQRDKRLILRNAMMLAGFKPIETEWWHFTLRNEPFPDTYFDFDIE